MVNDLNSQKEPRKIRVLAEIGYLILIFIGISILIFGVISLEDLDLKDMLTFLTISMILMFGTLVMRKDHYARRNGGSITKRQRSNMSFEIRTLKENIKDGSSVYTKNAMKNYIITLVIIYVSGGIRLAPALTLLIIGLPIISLYCYLSWNRVKAKMIRKSRDLQNTLSKSDIEDNI